MIPGIEEKRLVNGVIQNGWPSYATLHQASVSLQDMGDRVITTQVRIDGDVVPSFDGWELYFKGERFVLPSDNPQASKDNSTRNSIVDLQFQSWAIQELKRYYFFSVVSTAAGTIMPDQYRVPVRLTLPEFVALCNNVLEYYFGNKIVMSLYPGTTYATEPSVVEIDYTHIWDVVGKIFEIYGVRWIVKHDTTTDIYTISIGESPAPIADHDFEYGYKGGLLKFERQVQDETITNILLGRGGEKNLPYRYFKKVDPQNPTWAADPDAIPELASIYFDRLRDINFRWYVRGWMHNPSRDTSGDEAWDPGHVFPTYEISSDSPYYWAYQKGLTDTQFNPVEFVKDDASIEAYGERWGAADDNDEIYPTIQGRSRNPIGRIDEVVAVSPIVTDDIDAMAAASAVEKSIDRMVVTSPSSNPYTIDSDWFEIPTGQTGNIRYAWVGPTEGSSVTHIATDQSSIVAIDANGTEHPISGLSAGRYKLHLSLKLYVPSGYTTAGQWGLENIVLTTSAQDANAWKPTFDIWVKNIWGTTKGSGESPEEYAARVWEDILGDRAGNEAKVVFSTGFMSVSEDYEFVIASYPVYDTSKNINGVPSEWRITLRKSDAEYEATGLYIPNATTGGKPVAGDKFFFTGIDMPFLYVTLGEEDLNTNKSSQLEGLSVVNPTWVISLDKVRVHTLEDGEYGQTLADRLAAGAKLRITDPRFSGGDILTLYAQSITYTWNEPSENSPYIVPDIEVVLSDKVVSRQSRADKMESSIQEIRSNYARLDDVERVVRSVAEPMFLKKTGEADSSDSPTQFSSKVSSKGFRQGGVGGNGWGFYRDNTKEVAEGEEGEGDSVLEIDRIVVRKELEVNSLVVNQAEYRGGREIQSAAQIECTKVVVDDSGKYVCYFDQKQGSVKNLFVVGDFAYSTEFAPDNTVVKYYRRRVDAVDVDRIVLSDTVKDGAGVPAAGDVIIQYGHESNAARQYVIVRDVIGGGYERMISGLSTVSSNGDEYYFAGRQSGQYSNLPRWFVGAAAGEYAEYLNGQLNIKGRLQVLGESGNYSDLGYLADALPKKGATLIQGGLVLTSMIQLGQVENSAFKVYSGINGKVDETLADPTKTIAAWYGGEMLEKTAWDAMSAEDKLAHQYAKTIYRFDGSGYLAGGNIHWDENGYGGIPGITWSRPSGSQNDVITIGSNVILEASQGADQSVAALVSSVNSLQQILDWFEEVNLGTEQNPAWAVRLKKKTVGSSQLNRAFMTYGDQIVGTGTTGGGGGGATYLYELLDTLSSWSSKPSVDSMLVFDPNASSKSDSGAPTGAWKAVANTLSNIGDVTLTDVSNGQMLAWNGSAWVNVAAPTGTITSVALESGTNNGTLKLTVNGTPTDNIAVTGWSSKADASALNGYLPLTGGTMSGVITMPAYYQVQWASGATMIYGNATEVHVVGTLLVNGNTAYHSGNFTPSDYVKLTASSTQRISVNASGIYSVLSLRNMYYNQAWLDFVGANDTVLGSVGYNNGFKWHDGNAERLILLDNNIGSHAVTSVNGSGAGSITIDRVDYLNCPYDTTHSADNVSFQNLFDVTLFASVPGSSGGDGYVMSFDSAAQLYIDVDPTDIFQIRSKGSNGWNDWKTIYHSGNSNNSGTPWTCSILTVGTAAQTNYSAYIAGDTFVYGQIVSGKSTGAPLSIASTTRVDNLNADLLDGKHDGELTAKYLYCKYNGSSAASATLSAKSVTYDIFNSTSDTELVKIDPYGQVLSLSQSWENANFGCRLLYGVNDYTNFGYQSMRNGTWGSVYKFWHTGNSNKSDVDWTCNNLYVKGGTDSTYQSAKSSTITLQDYYLNHTIRVSGGDMNIGNSGAQNAYISIINNNGVHIGLCGAYSLSYALYVNGSTYTNGIFASAGDQVISSDLTKKTNFQAIKLTVKEIANAPAVTFDWKAGGHSFGSIAQYWKPLLGEMVLGEEGNYTLAYAQGAFVNAIINARAIVALQDHETEQDKEILELREALGRANEKIEGLEKEVKRLRMN